ncbi:MAG: hypothetical protein RBR08_09905 [Desulforegulaceae bacterium]|nr:hypothetical protein [Desulforegulaceae bacterium]
MEFLKAIEKFKDKKFLIPKPLIVVIEDVGWWNGRDGSQKNQPFRSGIKRNHDLNDYNALVLFAKSLGIQIIWGFVWCDWDRNNILKKLPCSTWMGKNWHVPVKDFSMLNKAAEIINSNKNHIEIAFHGLGHEFWENGILSRTEFHDFECNMRSSDEIENHFKAAREIIKTSGIHIRFPEIFIPPALKHSFGNGEKGFQKLLKNAGFKIVITLFEKARKYKPPIFEKFTKECTITIIERGVSPVQWNCIGAEPDFSFDWPLLSLHWTNLLHQNSEMNFKIVEKWAAFLREGSKKNGLILLPDIKNSIAQLIYSELADISETEKGIIIDLEKADALLSEYFDDTSQKMIHIFVENNDDLSLNLKGAKAVLVSKNGMYSIVPNEKNIEFVFN